MVLVRSGNDWATTMQPDQIAKVPSDMARPRTWLGKISEITIHGSGPSENAKNATNRAKGKTIRTLDWTSNDRLNCNQVATGAARPCR